MDNNIKVKNAKFILHQPSFENGYARNEYTQITKNNEEVVFTGEVAGEGTYKYILEEKEVGQISKAQVIDVLNSFLGKSKQKPPIYSAIKVNGKKYILEKLISKM